MACIGASLWSWYHWYSDNLLEQVKNAGEKNIPIHNIQPRFMKEFGRFCLADPSSINCLLLPCIVELYSLILWYCLVLWHCIALYRGIVLPCIVELNLLVLWHCITLYCGLLFAHHQDHLGPNLIVLFARIIVSNSQDQ